jgi:hypothetical protein
MRDSAAKDPDYPGEFDGEHKSAERMREFCDGVMTMNVAAQETTKQEIER